MRTLLVYTTIKKEDEFLNFRNYLVSLKEAFEVDGVVVCRAENKIHNTQYPQFIIIETAPNEKKTIED